MVQVKKAAPTSAMVLAAGLGRRMRPLTATRPKPLVEVAGRSLLDRALDTLKAGGVTDVVVNVHYMADSVEAHLAARPSGLNVQISDERALLLETGGGLTKALPLIKTDPFLSINADNIWIDGPVGGARLLAERWDDEAMDALLLLIPLARANCHGGPGDFHMDPLGRLSRRRPPRVAPFVYTGLQMLSKRLFEGVEATPFSMNSLWDKAAAEGRLYGVTHQGLWFDVGTAAAVKQTEALLDRF
ncbi:nucleotidyltransferase family protein [Sandaracinobacteroides hominis]|uniref:nucleotidyltransferase family protein n=1 Tax=Sandaracinobacteroides hominis TaxID=2780086 RepID=UPI0018F53E05